MSNIIQVLPQPGVTVHTAPVWQYDSGQVLRINGIALPASYKAEFSNTGRGDAISTVQTTAEILIPAHFLTSGSPVYIWLVVVDEQSRTTEYALQVPVAPRAKPIYTEPTPEEQTAMDQALAALNAGVAEVRDAARELETLSRVTSLDETALAPGNAIDAVGIPVYVQDIAPYAAYGITATGWYVFARIAAPAGEAVTAGTTVIGAAGYIATVGETHIDLAVRFDTTAQSVPVTIAWGAATDKFIFKASDLAARNLDYRTTYYVYDIEPFITWTWAMTTDTTFSEDKQYYTKDGDVYTLAQVQTKAYALTADTTFQNGKTYYTKDGDTYTAATVTVGDPVTADTYYEQSSVPVPENTYYNHSKLRFEGMTRNISYRLNTPIDCPIEIVLPEIPDDGYGCWFEIQVRALGGVSLTPEVPEGGQLASNTLAWTAKGIYYLDMHYANVAGLKLWRCVRTSFNV